MNKHLLRLAIAGCVFFAACDDACLAFLPICGLTVNVSGLSAQDSVTVAVKADNELTARTFVCEVQSGGCSHFFQDYVPPKISVQLLVCDSVIVSRTYVPAAVRSSTGCPSCTGGVVNVAL